MIDQFSNPGQNLHDARSLTPIAYLTCVQCGRRYQPTPDLYVCHDCGLRGILDVVYLYERAQISRESLAADPERTIWRYLPLLPLTQTETIPDLQVGWTPLYHARRLGAQLGLRHLYIKDDGRNPTGSFKDRSSALGVAKGLEFKKRTITCASTGNAASSLAGFAACSGVETYIFVPASAPEAKITQLLVYGANVLLVEGSYDEAYYLCNEAVERFGWYNRNCAINPYLIEGKKTVGFEICEQLNWAVPDRVVMAVGDGCSIAGAAKAFREAVQLGLTDRVPRMIGVQAEGCAPLTAAFERDEEPVFVRPQTMADSIAVGEPRNARKALDAIRSSGGTMVGVSDEAILEAMTLLARATGVFGEPAGTTALAGLGLLVARGEIDPDERIVVVVTGNGLKDVKSAQRATGKAPRIRPVLADVERVLEGMV